MGTLASTQRITRLFWAVAVRPKAVKTSTGPTSRTLR